MRSFLFIIFIAFSACTTRLNVWDVVLENVSGEITKIEPSKNKLTVIYFLSPECPLCVNYTLAMRNLEQEFGSDDLKFLGIFAKEWYSPEEVKNFALKYKLDFEMLFDDGNKLAHVLDATVTPEVFVLNSNSEIIYSGKIDNWVNELGKKKLEVSDHYLENALIAWHDGKAIEPNRTKPVGCLIE